jgi:hypothetical protein
MFRIAKIGFKKRRTVKEMHPNLVEKVANTRDKKVPPAQKEKIK